VSPSSSPAASTAVREALEAAVDALSAAGVDTPSLDAEVLLAEATGKTRASLIADADAGIDSGAGRSFAAMVRRRVAREPVAYIIGRKGFRRIELAVDRRVLIPRPETELLVEVALELRPRRLLDVGTGSGAVALAVADELDEVEVVATDTSAPALALARENASRLGLADRVRFEQASALPGPFDLTVANLPYVAEPDWPGLVPEITEYEPREALVGGPDGLDAIRAFVPDVTAGIVALEVGAGQADAVRELMKAEGFSDLEVRSDLAGIARIVLGRRPDRPR
jgi:release factor glutamine methyltransferase